MFVINIKWGTDGHTKSDRTSSGVALCDLKYLGWTLLTVVVVWYEVWGAITVARLLKYTLPLQCLHALTVRGAAELCGPSALPAATPVLSLQQTLA